MKSQKAMVKTCLACNHNK